MRRTGPILRQQKDTCSCWACRDRKTRETCKTDKQKVLKEEIEQGLNDDEIIYELNMKATYDTDLI